MRLIKSYDLTEEAERNGPRGETALGMSIWRRWFAKPLSRKDAERCVQVASEIRTLMQRRGVECTMKLFASIAAKEMYRCARANGFVKLSTKQRRIIAERTGREYAGAWQRISEYESRTLSDEARHWRDARGVSEASSKAASAEPHVVRRSWEEP